MLIPCFDCYKISNTVIFNPFIMEQLFMELEKMESVSCGDDYMHIITADGDKIIKISDLAKASVMHLCIIQAGVRNYDGMVLRAFCIPAPQPVIKMGNAVIHPTPTESCL